MPARRRHVDRSKEEDYLIMTACTHCGTELPGGLKFCKQCGTPVAAIRTEAASAPCRNCHAALTPNRRFCNKCGTPVASANDADAIEVEVDVPAPPAEPAPQPAYVAAKSAHEPAHGTVDVQDTQADIGVESMAANTAGNGISHVANTADPVSGRANAPLQSHDAAATATHIAAADHRGDAVAASPVVTDAQSTPAGVSAHTAAALAVDETDGVDAVANPHHVLNADVASPPAEPMRPASGVVPRPIPQTPTMNDDTSARLKIVAAGVAVAIACAGGAFWWHGRQASAPATPEPVAASTVAAFTVNAASDIAGPGSSTAGAVVATMPPDAPASAPTDTAAAAMTASASGPAVVTNVTTAPVPATSPASNAPPASANAQQPSPFAKLQDDTPTPTALAAVAETSRSKPHPTPPARPSTAANPAAPAVDGLLKRAQGDLSRGQYDKAIATAESVLAIEPGNRPAKTLIDKAKARQMDALRNNSTLE
ncbi:zinc-ribbon domain-containing protein [Burkholderia lata]|uniref:zinc-ribbon domain-containing protein n=1 Tax=Burkholderia lata (strain ATCC 17760 / DSM 23089 / LMG 22485 / NCIMB 9086 / R18194 / 383) TaxID=482957 RepID=UPI0009F59F86|nr:zinc ribbon domain-containing protein [Burkholderia lata]